MSDVDSKSPSVTTSMTRIRPGRFCRAKSWALVLMIECCAMARRRRGGREVTGSAWQKGAAFALTAYESTTNTGVTTTLDGGKLCLVGYDSYLLLVVRGWGAYARRLRLGKLRRRLDCRLDCSRRSLDRHRSGRGTRGSPSGRGGGGRALARCWKYALEAIINWLLLYFLVRDNRLLSMLELY